jgi:hypothetical protein
LVGDKLGFLGDGDRLLGDGRYWHVGGGRLDE